MEKYFQHPQFWIPSLDPAIKLLLIPTYIISSTTNQHKKKLHACARQVMLLNVIFLQHNKTALKWLCRLTWLHDGKRFCVGETQICVITYLFVVLWFFSVTFLECFLYNVHGVIWTNIEFLFWQFLIFLLSLKDKLHF